MEDCMSISLQTDPNNAVPNLPLSFAPNQNKMRDAMQF